MKTGKIIFYTAGILFLSGCDLLFNDSETPVDSVSREETCDCSKLSENFNNLQEKTINEGDPKAYKLFYNQSGNKFFTSNWEDNDRWHYKADRVTLDKTNGFLRIAYGRKDKDVNKPYTSGEIWSGTEMGQYNQYLYGIFEARIRIARGTGVVNTFFGYFDEDLKDPELLDQHEVNKEIDIEIFGENPGTIILFSCWTDRNNKTQVWFDARDMGIKDLSDDFHKYRIEWFPERVDFYVDNYLATSICTNIPQRELRLASGVWVAQNIFGGSWAMVNNKLYPGFPLPSSNNSGEFILDYICVNDLPAQKYGVCKSVPEKYPLGTTLSGQGAQGAEGDFDCWSDLYTAQGVRISPGWGNGRAYYDFGPVDKDKVTVEFQWVDNAWYSDVKKLEVFNWQTYAWETIAQWQGNDGKEHFSTYEVALTSGRKGPGNKVRIGIFGASWSVIHLNQITVK